MFQKWQEFGEFWSKRSNVYKKSTLAPFVQSMKRLTQKVQSSYLSWHWRVKQHLKIESLVVWKMTQGIWQIFTWTLRTLMGSVCPKQKMHELKIYRVMCNDTEKWWKIWKGIDLSVQNWYKEVDEHWPKDSKILKMWTAMGCFWPKYIMLRLKNT